MEPSSGMIKGGSIWAIRSPDGRPFETGQEQAGRTMTIVHRLIGYDGVTERLAIEHDIPASKLKYAKELARIPYEGIDAIGSYQLDASQAGAIAMLVYKEIDVDRYSWFLEPFDESDVEDTAA